MRGLQGCAMLSPQEGAAMTNAQILSQQEFTYKGRVGAFLFICGPIASGLVIERISSYQRPVTRPSGRRARVLLGLRHDVGWSDISA